MELSRELHGESRAHDKDDDGGTDEEIAALKQSNQSNLPRYLTAHLVQRPEQVIEVQKNDGVPPGREGAVERVRLSLADRIRQSEF